jgi:hypothetical protein
MSVTAETNNKQFSCEFCNRSFLRESTIAKHICEYKHRWQEKDKRGNQIGFQAWIQFYKRNTANTKKRTYLEYIKSSYYSAFAKFGTYCVDIKVINVSRYVDWLLKNKISIDVWNKDKNYTNFLIEYLRQEDPLDAIARSVETLQELSKEENLQYNDYFRYGNKNKICYNITTGRISPWMIYHSDSGLKFVDTLDETQVKLIIEYIDPEKWALKFMRNSEIVKTVKEILNAGRY